ncbi:MAG: glycosyltransferase family 4 protein [Pseudomonadota bacterium]
MRIIHVIRAPVGGLFRHVRDLIVCQAAQGHAVGLIYDRQHCDSLSIARLDDLRPYLEIGLFGLKMPRIPGIGDVRAAMQVAHLATHNTADVVHGHGAKGGLYARLSRLSASARSPSKGLPSRDLKAQDRLSAERQQQQRQQPPRIFYTPHGGSLHYRNGGLVGRSYGAVEALLLRLTDGILFESEFAANAFAEFTRQTPSATSVIHNGIGADDLEPVRQRENAADFVCVGELRHLKGFDVFLHALAELNRAVQPQRKPASAVIVGDGADRDKLEALAASLELIDQVRFTGAMPARSGFELGRCLVMPSRAESLPYIILEAAAAELPIVATDVGGVNEIVRGTRTNLVQASDVAALTRAMVSHLDDPDAAKSKAAELRQRIACHFTINTMSTAVLQAYQAAAHQHLPAIRKKPDMVSTQKASGII